MEQYKIDFESIPWQEPASGVRFKEYHQGGKQIRLVEFARGFVETDWCTKGHIGYILDGQLEINFDGKVVVLGPGNGLFIPPGENHKHIGKALTDAVQIFVIEDM